MHRWIPEVVRLIFEYVYDPVRTVEDIEGRIMVAGLARTCQAFKDPALDVLWTRLHSLDALVLCSGGRRDGNKRLIWDRPLYDAEWRILTRYGKRIRSLTVSGRLDTWPIITMQLLSCFPGHLLPNLRVLTWLSNREDFFPFLRCFCGPNLTTLRLSPSSWGIRKCVAVALLASSCPLLKKFTCANAEDSSMQAISEAVVGLNKLESLLVGPLDEQALTHAASLQTLQELWFSIPDLRSPVVKLCSPHYCISAPSPSFFYTFLRNVHFSTQRLLLFCRHHDDDDEQLHDHFFSRLQACFIHPEGLLELRLALKKIPHDEASFESVLVNDAVMQPLLSFTGLNFLDLADICTAYVNDTLLEEIALACPHLRELHLGDRGWWPIKPYATFKGVVSLSKHCRQLSTLGIFFDATFIINMPQVDAVNPNITDFLVGASDIDDPMKVAAVLSFLIPNAAIDHCILNSSPPDFQRTKEMWESVNTWLETFVSVRNHGWEQGWLEGRAAVEKNAVA